MARMAERAIEASNEGPEARRAAVDRAREGWIRRLIDLSRSNNLLYFRDLKIGTLDLAGHRPEIMARLLEDIEGDPRVIDVDALMPLPEEAEDRRQRLAALKTIRTRARDNLEERGLQTLHIAAGMATWPSADNGRPIAAPVLLYPMEMIERGREGRSFSLQRAGDAQVNLVLLQALETLCGVTIEPGQLVLEPGEGEPAPPNDLESVLARLAVLAENVKGFGVSGRMVLGNFAFQRMAMVKDLRELGPEMVAHDLIAALAGDGDARKAVIGNRTVAIDPRTFDARPPSAEFLVMDADSSQQTVVEAVLAGRDGVVQGPPGTGKSQTVVNLIASLAAEGKRILFVAEKRAALDVVLRRLDAIGLGHLALDLHGADTSRKAVAQRLSKALTTVRESVPVPDESIHARFSDRRARLNAHDQRMHVPRAPSGLSVFELQGRLLRARPGTRSAMRWRTGELEAITADAGVRVRDRLREAAGFRDLFQRTSASPWTGARLPDGPAVRAAVDDAAALATAWPRAHAAIDAMTAALGLPPAVTLGEAKRALDVSAAVAETLERYDPGVAAVLIERDAHAIPSKTGRPSALVSGLAPAEGNAVGRFLAGLFSGSYKRARRQARALRRTPVSPAQMRKELAEADERFAAWRALAGNAPPVETPTVGDASAAWAPFEALLFRMTPRFPEREFGSMALDSFDEFVRGLNADTATPGRLPALCAIEAELNACGVERFVHELRTESMRALDPELWPDAFDMAYFASCLDEIRLAEPELAGFNGETHNRFVAEFRSLDRQRLELARARVRRAHAQRAIDAMNDFPEQDAIIRREAAKKTRHRPMRRLLAEAPEVLTALTPCWMASPLSVSQLLDGRRQYFDVVVFDEASQVLPEDGVPSLLRARHAAVAGDAHQLPPTIFFAAGYDDPADAGDEDENATTGFESLLDLFRGFLEPWTLDWHYRSKDESLIAFSNREIYDNRMVTFPGPGIDGQGISHVLVTQAPGVEGQEESSSPEVRRVVELVIEHATRRPKETLGVIAPGIQHAQRLEAAIQAAARERPDLDDFFAEGHDERFFVKNLERVQGDERDAIILSVGYGKNAAGRLSHNFGPINQDGGERRLNVAITRARRRMTVLSSFTHHDIDPDRAKGRGPALLRAYLEYAASGGAKFGGSGASSVGLNHFEADVADALRAHGLDVVGQWGTSGYRLDLVVRHPEQPGRFVLAIECDGATYHSAHTARDRDRIRQQQLEGLGWRFHRIWSTDWFTDREREIRRAVEAARAGIAAIDAEASARDDSAAPAEPRAPFPGSPDTPAFVSSQALPSLPRPRIGRRGSIDDYSVGELVQLLRWIRSDGLLRTDDELLDRAMDELGFVRRGPRIEAAIREAIARTER